MDNWIPETSDEEFDIPYVKTVKKSTRGGKPTNVKLVEEFEEFEDFEDFEKIKKKKPNKKIPANNLKKDLVDDSIINITVA
jgi:hypothetical protein